MAGGDRGKLAILAATEKVLHQSKQPAGFCNCLLPHAVCLWVTQNSRRYMNSNNLFGLPGRRMHFFLSFTAIATLLLFSWFIYNYIVVPKHLTRARTSWQRQSMFPMSAAKKSRQRSTPRSFPKGAFRHRAAPPPSKCQPPHDLRPAYVFLFLFLFFSVNSGSCVRQQLSSGLGLHS